MRCTLCEAGNPVLVHQKVDPHHGERLYYQCQTCRLIFLDPAQYLSAWDEQSRYDLHQNSPDDQGYVDFLNQLLDPLSERLQPGAAGLDYGCGPGPTVSVIMRQRGFQMKDYDPLYANDTALIDQAYDFVTCTEVIEHFYQPARDLARLDRCVKPGGWMGLMTGMYRDVESFKGWWYHSEPTHVIFFHQDTFKWLSQKMGWTIEYLTDRVVIFQKIGVRVNSSS